MQVSLQILLLVKPYATNVLAQVMQTKRNTYSTKIILSNTDAVFWKSFPCLRKVPESSSDFSFE